MSTALTTGAALPDPGTWGVLREMAQVAIESRLLPEAVRTEQAAIFIALKARELNIPTTYGWSNIAVIKGKPVCGAELMLALVYRDHGDDALAFEESTDQRCVISYKRRTWTTRRTYSFTIDQAKAAGLTAGDNYRKYPAAMLRARCISAVCRMFAPDSIAGLYTPEEMGAAVTVTDEGEVVMAAEPERKEPATDHRQPITAELLSGKREPAPPAPVPTEAEPASANAVTEPQLRKLWAAAKQYNWAPESVKAAMRDLFDVDSSKLLTKHQASLLIDLVEDRLEMTYDEGGRARLGRAAPATAAEPALLDIDEAPFEPVGTAAG